MTEKRVSVRLSATGGRQVKAELEGVGEAGARGFGRLSREMEGANARLAVFARRAGVAMAAAAAAIAAAATAMVRSGLQTVDAQAKLAQSLGTTVASIQTLERAGELAGVSMSGIEQATKDLTRRLSQAAAGTGPAADALTRLGLTASGLMALPLDQRVGAINAAIAEFVPVAERAAVAGQLFGEEGSIAMARIDTATLRQATQDVRDFGVVVSEQDADQIERTNDAISRLGLIWRGLSNQLAVAAAPALESVADAMAAAARATGPLGVAIRVLFDNLGRLTSYAAGIAALMAGRFVAASIAAAVSVRGLAMTLVILRGALLRLPLIGLVVAAGELIHWFGRLVRGAGGFGNALSLLGDLAREVWERMQLGAVALGLSIMASWAEIKAAIAEALQTSLEAVVGFGNAALNTFQGAFEAIKVLWGALPGAIGDFAFQAANALIAGVEAMLNGVGQRINGFLEGINAGLEALGLERRISLIGNLELGRIDNPFAGSAAEAGTEARAAFQAAFNSEPIAMPDLGLGTYAQEARAEAEALRETLAGVVEAATAPLESIAALREAIAASGLEAEAGLMGARAAADGLEESLDATGEAAGRAGGAGRGAGQALREAADTARNAWEATTEAVSAAQERSRELAQGLAQDIVGPIKDALKSGEFTWETFASAISRIAQNLANRLIELAFQPIENAIMRAFSGMGGGGGGFFARLFGFAKGGIFASGQELTAFARGGVVNRPTVFPFAKGVGLMGEAGPEAILPLKRGRGGRLGVEMNGDGAGAAAQLSTRIINVLDPSVVGDYLATPSGERAILNVIRRNRSALNA
ncbi:phage tail tape measure protein [Pararhodobacter sp.]|uniref:phage tail tape measure protein n=1 Tax=Pararhodobacter sp. TaxID=2127056 RepID=UPI002AFFDB1A|nr:phage tail tape measure protein [Pararhodobacter sp.]